MDLMDREREFAIRELMRDLGWLPSDLNCEEKDASRRNIWMPQSNGLKPARDGGWIWLTGCVKATQSGGQQNIKDRII